MVGLSALLLSRTDARAQWPGRIDGPGTPPPASGFPDDDVPVVRPLILAQAAVRDGPATDTPAAPPPSTSAEPSMAELFEGFSLRPGPVRYGGSLSTDLRSSRAQNQPGALQLVSYQNIAAGTYIWQPWFAQVRAGAGFISSQTRTQGDVALVNGSSSSSSKSLTGDLAANVFPLSRFPFEFFASRGDSRASGEALGSDFTTTRIGLRQTYMPEDGTSRYTARFERNSLASSSIGEDVVTLYEATANRRFGPHAIEAAANHANNTGAAGGASSRFDRLNTRYSWMPASNMQIETLGSASRTVLRSGTAGSGSGDASSRFMQLTSFGSWRPEEGELLYDEERPIYLTASGRLFSIAAESPGQGTADAFSMSGSLGATYNWTPEMRLTGALNATQSRSGADTGLFTSQLAGVVYTPPPVRFSAATYTWSLSGTVANTTSTIDGNRQSVGGQVSHGLQRSFDAGGGSRISLNANQALGVAYDTAATSATSVSHGVSGTWFTSAESGAQTYVGLSANDVRSLGGQRSSFQLVNLQATRQNGITRLSYWAGNLTLQWTRQEARTVLPGQQVVGGLPLESSSGGTNLTSTGSLSYYHQRVFGVPRLRFTATVALASQQFDTRLSGNPDARRDNASSMAEGRLDYTIGRLEARLSARSAVIDGRTDHLVFLRVSRRFGLF